MPSKLRMTQTDGHTLVVKSPTKEFLAEALKALSTQKGVLTFEKNGRIHHLSASHLLRLEHSEEQDDTAQETEN